MFDASPNPYLVLDRALNIVGANKAYLAATKRELGDIVGRWAWDAFPTDSETLKQSIASFERAIHTKQPDTMALLRFDIPRPETEGGGFETRYWSIVHTPVLSEAGEVELVLQHPIDVTELQGLREAARLPENEPPAGLVPALSGMVDRAQAALRDSQERLKEAMDAARMVVWDWDLGSKRIKFSENALDILGGDWDDSEALLRSIHPEDKVRLRQAYLQATPKHPRYSAEFRIFRPDNGHMVWLENRGHVLFDAGGAPRYVKGVTLDVTESKHDEQALEDSRRRLALALSASGSAVWEMDVATGTLRGEDLLYTRLGYAPGELDTLADWQALIHADDRQGLPEMIQETIEGKRDKYRFEARLRAKDGSWRWNLSQAVAAERDAQGRAIRLVGTHTDISERKEAEAEIQRLNAELEQRVEKRTAELQRANEALLHTNMELQHFAHAAAHDLQTPLRSIAGFTLLLQRATQIQKDAEVQELTSRVIDNTKRLQRLIEELLAYTRLDAQGLPFDTVDLRDILDEVASALAVLIQETGAQICCDHLPAVSADRIQMAQLFQNLIENGIKYNHSKPPRVSIGCELQDDQWVFSVADNGIGIDPRHHERVFEIFRRLHSYHRVPGTGIGLALCRRIVERHGGRIWVESRVGEGSTFYFTLPARGGEALRLQKAGADRKLDPSVQG